MKKTRAGLPRLELARRLKVSASAVDRLITAGGLRSCGSRGKAKLYRLGDARKAMARAAKAGTETEFGRALYALLGAQASEARARVAELQAQYIHAREWQPAWRDLVAGVKHILTQWAREAPPRILALGVSYAAGRAVGFAIQSEEIRPLLTRLASISGGPTVERSTTTRPPTKSKASLVDAKRELISARAVVSALRAELKTDPRWRKSEALEYEMRQAIGNARALLWNAVPGRLLILLGSAPSESSVRRETQTIALEVVSTLEKLLTPPGAARAEKASA